MLSVLSQGALESLCGQYASSAQPELTALCVIQTHDTTDTVIQTPAHYSGADWVCAGIYVLSTGTPFEDRASNLATSGTIMTILISVGILGVPNAFKHAGGCHPISAPCKCLSFAARIPGVLT